MSIRIPTPAELRERGFRALVKELGYADAVRFLWQYEPGRGDYTEERRALFAGWTLEDVAREEERVRTQGQRAQERRDAGEGAGL